MSANWCKEKLGDIATFSQGIQIGLEYHENEPKDGYVRFIRIIDYTQNTDDIRYVKDPGEKYHVGLNDIVMVRYGSPGLIGRGKAGVIANNLFKISISKPEISEDYLSLYLAQEHIQNYLSTQGSSTMPALNFGQLKTVEVIFPGLTEQNQIVTILGEVFASIELAKANIQKNIQNAKELYKSKLNVILTTNTEDWEEKSIGEIANFSQGIQVGLKKHLYQPEEGYVRFIRIVDYTQNTEDIRYVPNPGDKYFVNEDDIVMVRYGSPGLIGRGKAGVIANNLFRITIDESINLSNDFLSLWLSQNSIQKYLSSQGSSTMPALNFGQLKTVRVSYPSVKKQTEIVDIITNLQERIDEIINVFERKDNSLDELKKSILQKVFAGELTNKPVTA